MDSSLAEIYISACCARLSVNMIPYLFYIKRNSRVTPNEKYIDLFKGSTDNIQYEVNDMESIVD